MRLLYRNKSKSKIYNIFSCTSLLYKTWFSNCFCKLLIWKCIQLLLSSLKLFYSPDRQYGIVFTEPAISFSIGISPLVLVGKIGVKAAGKAIYTVDSCVTITTRREYWEDKAENTNYTEYDANGSMGMRLLCQAVRRTLLIIPQVLYEWRPADT